MYKTEEIIEILKKNSTPENLAGMQRFGINPQHGLGTNMPTIRALAKQIKINHSLAHELWMTKIHEARILASLIANPKELTETEADTWVEEIYSWDLCDQFCLNLFSKTPYAISLAKRWCLAEYEYVKRAGFVIMAVLAVHDKKAEDVLFHEFLLELEKGATDNRNFVRKAVNWSIRQIGKRNMKLREKAIELCLKLKNTENKSSKWVASGALKELNDEKIVNRIRQKIL